MMGQSESGDYPSGMNPLLEPVSEDQGRLLGVIYEHFGRSGEWPIWQYVEMRFEDSDEANASETFSSLPTLYNGSLGRIQYQFAWTQNSFFNPNDKVGLTVAGLMHVSDAANLVNHYLTALEELVLIRKSLVPNPTEVVEQEIGWDTMVSILVQKEKVHSAPQLHRTAVAKVVRMFDHEPYIFNSQYFANGDEIESWRMKLPAALKRFEGVSDVADYVGRISTDAMSSSRPRLRQTLSPLALVNSLGYLDAVWQNTFKQALLPHSDIASSAKLALGCDSAEEFESRMAAFYDIMEHVKIPRGEVEPTKDGSVSRLEEFLLDALSESSSDRITEAASSLRQLLRIRSGSLHPSSRSKAATAFAELGIPYPPVSWSSTWDEIRVRGPQLVSQCQ